MSAILEATGILTSQSRLADKYLTFALGHESYGIPVLKVREIIRLLDITPIPQMPPYVRGVINLRGKVIPVIDLRAKFDLEKAERTEKTCIIVVRLTLLSGAMTQMGLVVDAVEEVVNIMAGDIEDTPSFGASVSTENILGMAKVKGVVKTLLDIDRIVSGQVVEQLSRGAVPASSRPSVAAMAS
ncbi:MAG: chemotaxis protein CheW [Verrucomicrobiae bacterium]|nr:chemotaxis protein CheW [Verrucomicrobiae bacterium]